METRSIVIGLVAVVAAFAAAFGMAKSGGSKTDTAGAGVKAQTIKVASPAAVTGVEVGGTLPALKAERKKAAKKKPTSTSNTSTPSASATATPAPSNTNTQSTTNTQSNNTQQTQTQTQTQTNKPQAEQPAAGGGEDG
jgi:hypothetical protein